MHKHTKRVTEGEMMRVSERSSSNDATCLLATGIVHVGSLNVLLLPGGAGKNSDSPPPSRGVTLIRNVGA